MQNRNGQEHLPGMVPLSAAPHSLQTSVGCHRGASDLGGLSQRCHPACQQLPPAAGSQRRLPVPLSQRCLHAPASGRLGRSRSSCRGLGPGESTAWQGGGGRGRGMWLGSSVVKGGCLSEEITIKRGPGPSSLMCSSLERKLHFQSA